jgi:hypothetical protein
MEQDVGKQDHIVRVAFNVNDRIDAGQQCFPPWRASTMSNNSQPGPNQKH